MRKEREDARQTTINQTSTGEVDPMSRTRRWRRDDDEPLYLMGL
jgi:hypothetical protein